MRVHAIVDYSFLYYKYKFRLDSGKIKRLTTPVIKNGVVVEKDISQIYYSIKEIEGFRKKLEKAGHDVTVSVCFDMPSGRKTNDTSGKYKLNRVKVLDETDFENIQLVERLLLQAGHNTYLFLGYEADDIVSYLVNVYKSSFDYTAIFTPDLDLLVNIAENVGASRYKSTKGYAPVDFDNFERYLRQELKCDIRYNNLMLYKCAVGDKSDNIDGIKGFGPKAFDKLMATIDDMNLDIDWSKMNDWKLVEKLILELYKRGALTDVQAEQAINSLSMVRPMEFGAIAPTKPIMQSSRECREAAYTPYNMASLVD